MNQLGRDDPMRYVPDPGEVEAAYEAEAPCHNLTHRTAEREIAALERLLNEQ